MLPVQQILAAVDFGDASDKALSVAAALGAAFGARVIALHAETFEPPPYFTRDQIARLERERTTLLAAAARHVSETAARVTTHPVQPLVVDDTAAHAVLSHADRADLVVMGTHGRRGPSRWWLGSVTERVLRHVRVPLLVVHGADPGEPGALASQILVVGGTAGPAAAWAEALAARLGGTVTASAAATCTPASAGQSSLVVVPLAAEDEDDRVQAEARALLRGCPRPMLFVPGMAGAGNATAREQGGTSAREKRR